MTLRALAELAGMIMRARGVIIVPTAPSHGQRSDIPALALRDGALGCSVLHPIQAPENVVKDVVLRREAVEAGEVIQLRTSAWDRASFPEPSPDLQTTRAYRLSDGELIGLVPGGRLVQ